MDTTKRQLAIYLAAEGKNTAQMAEMLNVNSSTVHQWLKDDRFQFEVKLLRHKIHGKGIQKRFEDMLPKAQDVTEEIITNPNIKPQLKFQAAQEVFDRALGKPKQTIEHQSNILRTIYERLDQNPEMTIDITPQEQQLKTLPEPQKTIELNPNTIELDPIDKWANENL